eukprot:TRINITY_DN112885_c0_g1_i1.p1 TRINITY_DN112885_c0_g1~~TRINITY_DN112885_c0_g1_i1.p1  ORF type:complete len:195 (+),score=23.16 TRINITY_DN112885_c0_g1_i1:62-646(+)
MKRTLSHEAEAAVIRLRDRGFTPAVVPPSCGGLNPLSVLGLSTDVHCWQQVRNAFIARLRQFPLEQHPEEFVLIVDAYQTLKRALRDTQPTANSDEGSVPTTKRRKAEVKEVSWKCPAPAMVIDCSGVVQHSTASPAPNDLSQEEGLIRSVSVRGPVATGYGASSSSSSMPCRVPTEGQGQVQLQQGPSAMCLG